MGNISEAARTLAERGSSSGGKARAAKMTPAERSEAARKAALARWSGEAALATHTGELEIGGKKIACAVLEDGTRVLTQETFLAAIGRAGKAKAGTGSTELVDDLPPFLVANNLKPFISNELRRSTTPIVFRSPTSGGKAFGFDAKLLPQVCEVYLAARDAGKLLPGQGHIAKACDILMRGLATVGIVALVDEATGYQEDRARDALAKILEEFISAELCKWVKTFPNEFYRELFRLRKINAARLSVKRPQYLGHLTNDIIYRRLAPGVLDELRRLTPKTKAGYRRHRYHQRLTEDAGHPKLREHLASVITLMRISDDWGSFYKMLNKALPKYKAMPLLENIQES